MTDTPDPTGRGRDDFSALPDPFVRFGARLLDPSTADRPAGGAAPSSTAYCGDRLLVTGRDDGDSRQLLGALGEEIAALGLRLEEPLPLDVIDGDERVPEIAEHNRVARILGEAAAVGLPLVFAVRLLPATDEPAPAVDAWPVLLRLRSRRTDIAPSFGLDHLMFPSATIGGHPVNPRGTASIGGSPVNPRATAFIGGNPVNPRATSASGVGSYFEPGGGGRGPVTLLMKPPHRDEKSPRPGVVVLDTGCGQHDWFTADPVNTVLRTSNNSSVGMDPSAPGFAATDPEGAGSILDPMSGSLASHAGHGTFIAGILRQICPEAQIHGLRVMDADGVVPEDRLVTSLTALGVWVSENPDQVHALVLSLGYYSESDEDEATGAGILKLLVALSDLGVVTFAAAGNDCTAERAYPAGFADAAEFASRLPLVAVRALNPDGSVALFSNDGDWVKGEAPGANIISTTPEGVDASLGPVVEFIGPHGRRRATIDIDDYASGFATWSGTSFAAPALAARYLARLVGAGVPTDHQARRKHVVLPAG